MKKQLILITAVWLLSLMIIVFISSKEHEKINGIYNVTINRIHQTFTDDLEKNNQIINDLKQEDLNLVKKIEIINYQDGIDTEKDAFFHKDFNFEETVVFKPIEGTNYLVKYHLDYNDPGNTIQTLWLILILTGAYGYFLFHIIMVHKNIVNPLRKVTDITKQLARGYLREVNLQNKDKYFSDFIWGLDMLREQLVYEREKNIDLEKKRRTLVAGLSHDIKTPLSSVKNYVIALKENVYEEKEEINHALEIILDKVEVIEKLSKELLDSSIKEVREIEVKPKEIYIDEVHNRINKIIRQKTDLFHMDYSEARLADNILLLVDIERLLEVVDNIIENAMKYGDLKSIKISYAVEENYQLIEIHNTGNPIPKSELKFIFNSYYRGSNVSDKTGYGLGLYISKQIMKNMQGDIYAKNTEDGVSFIIVIKQAG